MDIFIRTCTKNPLRRAMLETCKQAWKLQKGFNKLVVIHSAMLPRGDFHWESRRFAAKHAGSDPYIFADDDCLPLTLDFVKNAKRISKENPEYTLIGASNAIYPEKGWQGAWHHPGVVSEVPAIGGIVIHRKGVLDYLELSGAVDKQDDEIAHHLRSRGLKLGLSLELHFNHLGYSWSESSPLCWGKI